MQQSRNSLKRIAIVGPECTGKTSLAKRLSQDFHTAWVPEYARDFLKQLDRPYTQADLLTIAEGQLALEDEIASTANNILVCDTNLYVIKIWSEFKYGTCDPRILNAIATRHYDYYLLTNIDLPWEADPQREHPHEREALFNIYHQELASQPVPYSIINFEGEERFQLAKEIVKKVLHSNA
jgi:NadR type nicotinamide-nucleotide adenylyltransferase